VIHEFLDAEPVMRAPPTREHAVRYVSVDLDCTFSTAPSAAYDRCRRESYDVVHHDADVPIDVADHGHHLEFAARSRRLATDRSGAF